MTLSRVLIWIFRSSPYFEQNGIGAVGVAAPAFIFNKLASVFFFWAALGLGSNSLLLLISLFSPCVRSLPEDDRFLLYHPLGLFNIRATVTLVAQDHKCRPAHKVPVCFWHSSVLQLCCCTEQTLSADNCSIRHPAK